MRGGQQDIGSLSEQKNFFEMPLQVRQLNHQHLMPKTAGMEEERNGLIRSRKFQLLWTWVDSKTGQLIGFCPMAILKPSSRRSPGRGVDDGSWRRAHPTPQRDGQRRRKQGSKCAS